MSWFSAPRAKSLQIGHTRSPYSVTVTLAFGEPSVAPCCGIPARSVLTVAWAFFAAALLGATTFALLPPEEMAMATATSAMAPTSVPPSMRRRRSRRARSARACSSASRRWRAASFCSLREAMR